MTFAQKIQDERTKLTKEHVLALKDVLEPAVIAEKFKLPLKQVLKILGQK